MLVALRELAGAAVGRAIAPAVASISRARQARMFHPEGHTFAGRVEATPAAGSFGALGAALEGPVLARFSGALWRHGREHLEVLGAALRFRRDELANPDSLPGDQDLLFATIVSPFTMPFSPFTTDARDYWNNRYWAVSPFDASSVGRVKFRLTPTPPPPHSQLPREERLLAIVAAQRAILHLEARRTFSATWTTVARITLESSLAIDQAALRFSAFHCGRGITPRGLVHAIRRPAYAASQGARPAKADAADPVR